MKLLSVAGARPNFMKLAAIAWAVDNFNNTISPDNCAIQHVIVHTGQHYDKKMSQTFFDDLAIPKPDINLEVGSGSHAVQTAEIMKKFEPVLLAEQPDVLLVVGDVNSTIACSLVAAKIEYPANSNRRRPLIVHVEAGLRSFDPDMPEEINRILTDSISDLLFVTEESGINNLRHSGVPDEKIHMVGNVMIDTLQRHLKKARLSDIREQLALPERYGIVTLHRPSNVDTQETLEPLLSAIHTISQDIPLIFPIHPRTLKHIELFGLTSLVNWSTYPDDELQHDHSSAGSNSGVFIMPPLGYLDFLSLVEKASLVITDSGGIQEETTYLQIPCMTLRHNTERPITVTIGSNYLLGTSPEKILETASSILKGSAKTGSIPDKWDGMAGTRVVDIIYHEYLAQKNNNSIEQVRV
ncbi:non-hydrolyzing UDP-N-acetylglucosamine 2-epimerase [Desulfopila aestuarii]|uniref:UDP-N-acetylglucosamine 2-epimerase (Non-hydrolysing) n=1 Tax=Desulfopila aestuarii DSM 18488 TaxID=1121416 RepID=A0A1M7YFT9_9BACT|nr:UDP-N-acetylglucosamine 2-epimerase (non-hydrolyzing) [Desulfopila aestuarii]SHO51451.1 UDP-N-acetylglucosamine 2-epimerase (non-hydrolysing) [Desulfopila aestuarii DSM 18488]